MLLKTARRFLFFLLLVVVCQSAWSQSEPVMDSVLRGKDGKLMIGAKAYVQDAVFFDPVLKPTIYQTNKVDNIITLRLNEYDTLQLPDSFQFKAKIRIRYTNVNSVVNTVDTSLTIDYNKARTYVNRAHFSFSNAYEVEVEVLDLQVPAPSSLAASVHAVELENLMVIDRDYKMDCSLDAIRQITPGTTAGILVNGELQVSWPLNRVSEEYDLEWTFIDSSSLVNGRYHLAGVLRPELLFENNATRVTVTGTSYAIPMLYDYAGTLFYRVRGAQVLANGKRNALPWSSDFVADGGLGAYLVESPEAHEPLLNWQASTSFAEEGKRKTVIQYFDGSLKNRQTVTKDNTTGTTVVAETFYDKQGRPAIQVLPAPTLNQLISFTPNFNHNINQAPYEYEKELYDADHEEGEPVDCSAGAPLMGSSNSGAANYYSSSNPEVNTGIHQYIPEANGYAFSETRYTSDNSGRISRQGGVGSEFQLGAGHEGKYYYGSPDQQELDALFGTEVGEASHYQKNMVRDANGQYSVSYVDMHGRTVATALAGENPGNLDRLASYQTATQTNELLNATNNIIKGTSIESTKGLLVTRPGVHTFTYGLAGLSLEMEDCSPEPVCYDCLYDLEITVTDDCNNQTLPGGVPYKYTHQNFSFATIDTTCSNPASAFALSFDLNLVEGSYQVNKKLTINEQAMAYYRDSIFMRRNTCKSYEDIVAEQRAVILEQLGDCSLVSDSSYDYESVLKQIMEDVTPSGGQYANRDLVLGKSIFSRSIESGSKYVYQQSSILYKDEDGTPSLVEVDDDGQRVLRTPNALTPDEFINNFRSSWAKALAAAHPEDELWVTYEKLKSSHIWDEDFAGTQTYAEAVTKGYLNPANNTLTAPFSQFAGSVTYADPLYAAITSNFSGTLATLARQNIEDSIRLFRKINNNWYSVYAIATIIGSRPGEGALSDQEGDLYRNNLFPSSMCAGEADMAWKFFRDMYLHFKREYVQQFIRAQNPTVSYPVPPLRSIFPVYSTEMAKEGYTNIWETDPAVVYSEANTRFAQQAAQTCREYVSQWWQQLAPCGYTTADTAIIMPRLVEVCKQGSDIDHPFGASSVPASSTYTYRSFEDVIAQYNALTGKTTSADCNGLLINAPKSYDQPTFKVDKAVNYKPQPCDCERITEVHAQYLSSPGSATTFSQYLNINYQAQIAQGSLDTLIGLCSGTITCKWIPQVITIPRILQCGGASTCIDCEAFTTAYNGFKTAYPGVEPVLVDTNVVQSNANFLFKTYMNNKFGFSKSAAEYLAFGDSCGTMAMTRCDSLKQIVEDYQKIRKEIKEGKAAYGYRITPLLEEIKEGMNGLLEWNRRQSTGRYLSPRYKYQPTNNAMVNKLYSISYTTPSDADSVFHMVLPLNLDYIYNPYGYFNKLSNTQQLDASDFTGYSSIAEAKNKYYGVTLMDEWGRWRLMWGTQKTWNGSTGACEWPSIADYYGQSAPMTKLLSDSLCNEITNGAVALALYPLPASISNIAQYQNHRDFIESKIFRGPGDPVAYDNHLPDLALRDTLKSSPFLFHNADIYSIQQFYLDTAFLRLYQQSGAPYSHLRKGDFIKATLKMMDGSVNEANLYSLEYLHLYKEEVDTAIYSQDCQIGFAAYFNSIRGTNLTYSAIQALYNDSCGVNLDVCDTALSCTRLNSLVSAYQQAFIAPKAGYVDLPMRTFAGNKTPLEGPKGVFNVTNQLVGQTTGTTITEINNSFASIWNADSANAVVGHLAALSDGRFRLTINAGQIAPCQGIIGQRFYQFDVNVYDTAMTQFYTTEGSYLDFGDSSKYFLKAPPLQPVLVTTGNISPDSKSSFNFNNYGWKHSENANYLGADYKIGKTITILHRYAKPQATWASYTVTVYHTDVKGLVGFQAPLISGGAQTKPSTFNLRGYWPQQTYKVLFESMQDSTIARTRLIRNFKQINSIQLFEISVRTGATYVSDINIESFENNRELQFLWYDRSGRGELPVRAGKTYSEISGTPMYKAFPNLPANFPHLRVLNMYGWKGMEKELDSTNFSLSKMRMLEFALKDSMRSYQIDTILNQVARLNDQSQGLLSYYYGTPYAEAPTAASTAARAKLTSQSWALPGMNSNTALDLSITYANVLIDRDSMVLEHGFSDYVNEVLGTSYTYPQLQELHQQLCGSPLSLCNVTPAVLSSVRLCDNSGAGDTTQFVQSGPCGDSSLLITLTAVEIYRAYRDSIYNKFNEEYSKKCLTASQVESLTVTRPWSEYHYTLYYYDQAGNLVKTIPPAGVKPITDAVRLAAMTDKRVQFLIDTPGHDLQTIYRYNSLNQVVIQRSPDANISRFWYDRLGRLVLSQNAKQYGDRDYSYTIYDPIGRIIEIGQKYQPMALPATTLRNPVALQKWIDFRSDTYQPKFVTETRYDEVSLLQGVYSSQTPFRQKPWTLRTRVSSVRHYEQQAHYRSINGTDTTYFPNTANYQSAIDYNYDIHGNVDSMLNIYNVGTVMNAHNANKFKLITYDYDLISGKVNQVHYNPGKNDEFYHRYSYDAENRLTDVYTTDSKVFIGREGLEDHEAHYQYYKHGPLAREVIGHQQVQGVDYAYTLQGWIKGVNNTTLTMVGDMGGDGLVTGQDAYSYNLNYFSGDYQAISNKQPFADQVTGLGANHRPLYNGNINSMVVNIRQFNEPQLYNYKYDQLNRIVSMDVYRGLSTANNNWNSMAITTDYRERVTYDPNGNILTYTRNGRAPVQAMDNMTYSYYDKTNKLRHIKDAVSASNYSDDLDTQPTGNYEYDEVGNLVSDPANRIITIQWTPYGKISKISKQLSNVPPGSATVIDYEYDVTGNRISSMQTKNISGSTVYDYTFYVRDAQGNVMAEYEKRQQGGSGDLYLKRHYIYGSKRMGLLNRNQDVDEVKGESGMIPLLGTYRIDASARGARNYELTNHLGNVLLTINDVKTSVVNGSGAITHATPTVLTANDYYPFGMLMPGRKYNAPTVNDYKFGFNGKENDDAVKGEGNQQDYGMRIYDPRAGKFLSVDPLARAYPWYTPYQFAGNDVIRNNDVDGEEPDLKTISEAQRQQAIIHYEIAESQRLYPHGFFSLHKPSIGEMAYKYFNDPTNEIQFNTSPALAAGKFLFSIADDVKILGTSFASSGREATHIGGKSANFNERMGAFINVSTTAMGLGEAGMNGSVQFDDIVSQGQFAEEAMGKWNKGNLLVDAPNFKTFDMFDGKTAQSIKSLNVTRGSYLTNPNSITRRLNKYTNQVLSFESASMNRITLTSSMIETRALGVMVFGRPTAAQQLALRAAAKFSTSSGVQFSLKMAQTPVSVARMLSPNTVFRGANVISKTE